jgi:tetratricopeptide (TPR) repeat protein
VPLVETIQDTRPDFPGLEDLTARLDTGLRLEDQYEAALALVDEGELAEALELFQGIEAEQPGLWDVRQQIAALDGARPSWRATWTRARPPTKSGDWAGVISAYEAALALDSTLADPQIKEHLLRAYFSQAIRILERDEVSIEDLEAAEGFYRAGRSCCPRWGPTPASSPACRRPPATCWPRSSPWRPPAPVADVNQTATSLAQAVGFMRRAVNLLPADEDLRQNLADTESYVLGYQYFVGQNWAGAITSLEPLVESDPTYAAGNAAVLLFEALTAEGAQLAAMEEYEARPGNPAEGRSPGRGRPRQPGAVIPGAGPDWRPAG